jgi:hypothetical protein
MGNITELYGGLNGLNGNTYKPDICLNWNIIKVPFVRHVKSPEGPRRYIKKPAQVQGTRTYCIAFH